MVEAMRAAMAGGITSVAHVANSLMRVVTAASPAINVKRLQVMVPELSLPAKAAQLDHRQNEIQPVTSPPSRVTCLFNAKLGQVLRRILRNQPAIVADGDENANFHANASPQCPLCCTMLTKQE